MQKQQKKKRSSRWSGFFTLMIVPDARCSIRSWRLSWNLIRFIGLGLLIVTGGSIFLAYAYLDAVIQLKDLR